jgi:hypothetical protein
MCRISVAWTDHKGIQQTQAGLLEDRSLTGAGISVIHPIPVGTKVTFRGRKRELAGIVRYCRRGRLNYQVGIRLDQTDEAWATIGAGL